MKISCCFATALLALILPFEARGAGGAPRSLSDQFEGLQFRNIGPFRGGRVAAVCGVPSKPLTFFFGGTGGGVWKTMDGGSSWEAVSDKDFKTGSVGSIAVADSDPNVIYAGMGEGPIRGNTSHGDGVYKSTDSGKTWANVGLKSAQQIPALRIHPKDAELVYAAAQGHAWGPNEERGIFRTQDGGKTWKKVLFVDATAGASDLAMDPTNPRVLFAGFWQVQRKPWALASGGEKGGVWKSTDGGDTWKKLAGGLPEDVVGKIGIAVSPARPERVWAMVEAEKGGLFRSEDGGEKWTKVNEENKLRQRAWYYSNVIADPKSPDTVYVMNVQFHKSVDGGKTFATLRVPHGDNHALWIDPNDPNRMINGNDGGATVSFDGGRSWSTVLNQPTAQFYRVITDGRFPYRVYGAQQDNSTVSIPSRARGAGIGITEWHDVGGCESGWIAPNPKDAEIVYAGCYGGAIERYDHRTGEERNIIAWPQLAIGQAPKDLKYRFQWNAPILVSPHDPKTLYHAAQVLLMSRDEGETWQEISPDLTRNDKSKQEKSGGPITKDDTGVEVYDTIFAVAESPHEAGTIWAGSDDGLVHVTRDGGKNWKNVTPGRESPIRSTSSGRTGGVRGASNEQPPGERLPEWIQVNAIEVSPHDKAAAYVAATMYKHDDFRPYLYRTIDYGATWAKITNGIPDGAFTRVVREDAIRRGLLYCGTETGLYVSWDDGGSWQPFQRNLPVVPITDIAVKDEDLVVATQGRSFWILDDLTPLHQWNDAVSRKDVFLFAPRASVRMRMGGGGGGESEGPGPRGVGKNPPNGVLVNYWLKEKPAEKPKGAEVVTIEILDGEKVLRSFNSEKKDKEKEGDAGAEPDEEKPLEPKQGLNRFAWDMRMLKPALVPKAIIWGGKDGPKVAPGTYRVRLRKGDTTLTESFEIRANPGLHVSPADLKKQGDLLAAVRDRVTETHQAVLQIRDVKAQIKDLTSRAKKLGKGDGLEEKAKELTGKLDALEEKLVNPKMKSEQDVLNFQPRLDHQFVGIASVVSSADAAPTKASVELYGELEKQFREVLADRDGIFAKDLADFNKAVRERDIPPISVLPPKEGGRK